MGRKYDASTTFNANFQIGKAAPLDNRDVVDTYSDLETSIGVNKYVGELVYVTNDSTVNNVTYPKGFYMYDETDGWIPFTGGGEATLGKAVPSVLEVGGITAGTTLSADTTFYDFVNMLLNPVLYPTFVAPSASMTQYTTALYAVGDTVAAKTITVTYDAGAINLNGVKQNDRGGAATGFAIATDGADTEFSDSDASSGSFNVTALTRSTKGNIVITGTVTHAAGAQPKDSSGADYGSPLAAGSVTTTQTLEFIFPFYYGVSNTATVSSLSGLTTSLQKKGNKTFTFTQNNQYAVVAYDSSYGNLSKIIEQSTGYDVISGWTKYTDISGFYVYVENSPHTSSSASYTFQF